MEIKSRKRSGISAPDATEGERMRDTVPQDRGPQGRKDKVEGTKGLPPQTELWFQHIPASKSQSHSQEEKPGKCGK